MIIIFYKYEHNSCNLGVNVVYYFIFILSVVCISFISFRSDTDRKKLDYKGAVIRK